MADTEMRGKLQHPADVAASIAWFGDAARQIRDHSASPALLREMNARAVELIKAERFEDAAEVLAPVKLDEVLIRGDGNTVLSTAERGDLQSGRGSLRQFGKATPETLALTSNYAAALIELGDWDRAEATLETILTLPTALDFPREAALALGNLAAIRAGQGKLAEAADLLREAIVRIDDCSGVHDTDRARLLQSLAEVLGEMGQTEAARDAQAQADAVIRRHPTAAE